jgi:flavorubredoxin
MSMPKMAIIYASGMGRTKQMAEAIANGAKTIDGVDVILKDAQETSLDDIKDVAAILLGGSTYNYKLIKSMNPFLKELEKLDLKEKIGAAFGSYGWSGESIPTLIARMKSFGMKVIEPGTTAIQVPNAEAIEKCFKLGRTVAMGLTS